MEASMENMEKVGKSFFFLKCMQIDTYLFSSFSLYIYIWSIRENIKLIHIGIFIVY